MGKRKFREIFPKVTELRDGAARYRIQVARALYHTGPLLFSHPFPFPYALSKAHVWLS